MNDLGDALAWPVRDGDWIAKVVLMSLITIIPVVGEIALLGWMLAALDNLRAGRRELPAAGFGHLGKGFPLWLVSLVYRLAVVVIAFLVLLVALLVGGAVGTAGSAARGAAVAIGTVLAAAVTIAGLLGVLYLAPGIVLETDRTGIAGGLRINGVLALAQRRPERTLIAALSLVVAYLVGSLGSVICGVGIFLTIAYGYAVAAGIIRRYELELGAPSQMPAPPAPQ